MKYSPIKIVLLFLILSQSVVAAPDYVTAWPKKVKVETPDAVLGDKPFWEYWSYSHLFAKTFKGLSPDGVDPELKNEIQAIVLRIFKRNLWEGVNSDYPKQYTCEVDVYFNNSIKIPFAKKQREYLPPEYPENITPSITRVKLNNGNDLKLNNIVTLSQGVTVLPRVFSLPIDGRYTSLGIKIYYPDITPTTSMIVLGQGVHSCEVLAPLKMGGEHWVSLLGDIPYEKFRPNASRGIYDSDTKNIKPNLSSMNFKNGYFKIPDKFYRDLLPKLTLAKVLNICIQKENAFSNAIKNNKEINNVAQKEMTERCHDIRNYGVISEPSFRSTRESGLTDTGY